MRWAFTILGVLLAGVALITLWFLWPVITAGAKQTKPERGVIALSQPLKPGCSVNAELSIDLMGEGRVTESGKPAAASVMVARDGCMDLDRPLVAFNWWTLRHWWQGVLMTRYQLYAGQQVVNKANVTSFVFAGRGPKVLLLPPGTGPAYGAAWALPWTHQGATMPFYPSAKSIMHMVDASRDRYLEEIDIKHNAMGIDGYFGMQDCIANCAALLKPDREGIWEFLYPEVATPVLAIHAKIARADADAFLAAVTGAPNFEVVYAGWTVADLMVEAEDKTREPFLQKPLWQDLTVLIRPKDTVTITVAADSLMGAGAFQTLRQKSEVLALLQY